MMSCDALLSDTDTDTDIVSDTRPKVLSFDAAQQRLSADAPLPADVEFVPVSKCAGYVLAEQVSTVLDLPHGDSSAMDGYAIRHEDYAPGKTLEVQERCYAGDLPSPLCAGYATRLFTGTMMPAHADTVVMQEYVRERGSAIEIVAEPRQGQHVRKRGEDVRAGQPLLAAGTLVRPAQIALMSAQGIDRVPVFSKLRVGILTTGDELVSAGNARTPQQTFDSNGPMLASLIEGMGASVSRVVHVRDSEFEIRCALAQLLPHCDLIISAGGASVGERDLVRTTIESLGGTISVWQVRMKPGKPVALASVLGKPFVCLPGNPAAAFAVFTLLITPMIRRMQGRTAILPPVPQFALDIERKGHEYRDEFLRVRSIVDEEGRIRLVPFEQQSPAALSSLAQASGLARVRPGCSVKCGDLAPYYDFHHWLV
jgi:molybdopterin molybdotransferase